MQYIATFHTHFGAIRFREFARERSIGCTLMPVPRILSSSCGTCARYEAGSWDIGFADESLEGIYGFDPNGSVRVFFKEKEQ